MPSKNNGGRGLKLNRRQILSGMATGTLTLPLISGNGAAAYDYEKIEGNYDRKRIRDTRSDPINNDYKVTLGTELNTLGSFHSTEGKWNHKFGINSQSVAFDSTENEKETLLNSHAFEVDATHEDSNVVLWFPDKDSGVIGAKPADWGDTISTHYKTAIKNTAALVNAKFAAAWSASEIIDALLDAGSKNGSGKQRRYEWSPSGDYQDLAHQGKFQVTHPDSTSISTYVNVHSNNTTWISFLLTLGTDGGNWISDIDPQTQGFSSLNNKKPGIVSREEAKKGMERAKNAGEGIPNPENMSRKEKNKWGVRKPKEHETKAIPNSELRSKNIDYVADDMPTYVYGLEPPQ